MKLIFGKKGKERKINSSYEWLPHPLSILFYLKKNKYVGSIIKYSKFKNKKKTNLKISYLKKKFKLFVHSGNNFNSTKYIVDIKTDKNHYVYDGTHPTTLRINSKIYHFKYKPLFNSIFIFQKY